MKWAGARAPPGPIGSPASLVTPDFASMHMLPRGRTSALQREPLERGSPREVRGGGSQPAVTFRGRDPVGEPSRAGDWHGLLGSKKIEIDPFEGIPTGRPRKLDKVASFVALLADILCAGYRSATVRARYPHL